MRRGLAWVAGAVGLAALLRALKSRRHQTPDVAPAPDPADELRAAIAEQREEEAPPEPKPASVEERRQQVHERAQEAIDAMRDPDA